MLNKLKQLKEDFLQNLEQIESEPKAEELKKD